jgi:hypothetical protein
MKEPMHDALAEFGPRREFIIDVKSIVIAGEARECGHVLRRNCTGNTLSLTNSQRMKAVTSAHAHIFAFAPALCRSCQSDNQRHLQQS